MTDLAVNVDQLLDQLAQRVIEGLADRVLDVLPTRYLTARETAAYLHISDNTLYGLTARNAIPHKRLGRQLLFRAAEIDAWLDGGQR